MHYIRRSIRVVAALVVLLVTFIGAACRGQGQSSTDLQQMADELLPRLQVLAGLEARAPIKLEWQSREAMRSYVERQLTEEMPPEEMAGIQAAYAAFGMIPDTLDLRRLLLDLYSEQVVGYYDPTTKALYLVEGASDRDVRTVLAHELVHALQDQHVDLDSLVSSKRGNDRQSAAQAALEGQATLVMFVLLMEQQLGGNLDPAQLPDLSTQLEPLLEAQNSQFPIFRGAPRVIRETLLFPYLGGAAFVQALWRAAAVAPGTDGGERYPAPVDSLLPQSTEQVLRPTEHFLVVRDEPTEVELASPADSWNVIYENTLGELETGILLQDHLGAGANLEARGWDGDRYRLLETPAGGRALVWYSVWDDAPAADRFAAAYRQVLQTRGDRRGRVERLEVQGRPMVLVIDAEAALDPAAVPSSAVVKLEEG